MKAISWVLCAAASMGCSDSGSGVAADMSPGDAGADAGAMANVVTVAEDGVIDAPNLEIAAGEAVTFQLGTRWQSVVGISSLDAAACDGPDLELPYDEIGLTGPMPRIAGGVTVRGAPDGSFRFAPEVWTSDAVSGVLLVIPWQDLEPTPEAYDFAVFTDALTEATKYGKLVSVGVQAGARCPDWIFTDGDVSGIPMITKATGGLKCFDQTHPHFWDPDYVALLTRLQTALSETLLAHGGAYRHIDKIKISGINLMTSETRMPVERSTFCGFEDARCSNRAMPAVPCVGGVCPLDPALNCGCYEETPGGPELCGRQTGDQPQQWADAGYRPSELRDYFEALFTEQQSLFPDKDINLMEIARAFPNVDQAGVVQGFADPDHVSRLIEIGISTVPDRFVVLNAALRGGPPQEICLQAFDDGAAQIGFQSVNGLNTWADLEPALVSARDTLTPGGAADSVTFIEIYNQSLTASVGSGNSDDLRAFDELFRARSGLPNDTGEEHVVEGLEPGTYHYKIAGTQMNGGACHLGTITVTP